MSSGDNSGAAAAAQLPATGLRQGSMLLERALICAAAAIYLWIFNAVLPHGDALRIVRQIEADDLIWNPNHLIFDPLGYGFYRLVSGFAPGFTSLATFEFLSAVATLVSLVIFHAILIRAGVRSAAIRLLSVAGLFASATFLAQGVSQYYFMVQMPLLLGALYLYLDFLIKQREQRPADANLYGMGVLLAVAAGVMFNNLLLVMAAGVAVAFVHASLGKIEWRNSVKLYVAAALVGFPIFVAGYFLSGTDKGLLTWVLAYQGDASSNLNELYGIKWTIAGVAQTATMVVYNLFLGSMVETAGFGTVLQVLAFGQEFEFLPQWSKILLSLLVIPAVAALNLSVAYAVLRRARGEPVYRLLAIWIVAYLVFNFLWNVGDEIFWIQIVPVLWLAMLLTNRATDGRLLLAANAAPAFARWKRVALLLFVLALLAINTVNVAAPTAARDFYRNQSAHAALLRDGDMEILPGWDQQKWLMLGEQSPRVERVVLMNRAVAAMSSAEQMQQLPQLVDARLRSGHRVVVARVFDLDHDLMPWYALKATGWPRKRIEELFGGFCNREIAKISGVVFRELYICDAGEKSVAPPAAEPGN